MACLILTICLGYDATIKQQHGQDQARNMIRIVGFVSRTINASPPAGWLTP